MGDRALVCIVDDDAAVGEIVRRALEASGDFDCRVYTSAQRFLEDCDGCSATCVVTDLKMPDVDGAELLRRVHRLDSALGVVILTAFADVPTTVRLLEQGAVTLVEKPYKAADLVAAVRRAAARTKTLRAADTALRAAQINRTRLTTEEQHVLDCMVAGLTNKAIALKLGLSPRTLDRRRRHILTTMSVNSVAELAALVSRIAPPNV